MSEPSSPATLDDALPEAARRPLATLAVLVVLAGSFGAAVAWGRLSPWSPDAEQLFRCGGAFGPAIVDGQWWRFASPVLVHAGVVHLAVNLWFLWGIRRAERVFGPGGYLAILALSGIGGTIVGVLVRPFTVLVGASGGLFGLVGALLAFSFLHRGVVPSGVLRNERRTLGSLLLVNLAISVAVPAISLAGHLGGLGTGFLAGWLLQGDLSDAGADRGRRAVRALAFLVVLAVAAAGVRVVISHTPEIRASDLVEEARAALRSNDAARAEKLLTEAIATSPSGRAHLIRGWARSRLGRLPEALADLDEAVRLLPSDPAARRTRGAVREQNGDRDLAIADYERALLLDPEDSRARARLDALRSGAPAPPRGR